MGKKALIILSIIIFLVLVIILAIIFVSNSMKNNLENLSINNVDMSIVEDGDYVGEYSSFPVKVKVMVTVKDHKITSIDIIEHDNGEGQKAEIIINDVIEKQSLDVEIISGATYSSKVILKAIENALKK